MSEAQRVNELFRKIAAIERRIHKLEHGMAEFHAVIAPQGWIGQAFERVEEDLTEIFAKFEAVDRKIDIILQHITGMSQSSEN